MDRPRALADGQHLAQLTLFRGKFKQIKPLPACADNGRAAVGRRDHVQCMPNDPQIFTLVQVRAFSPEAYKPSAMPGAGSAQNPRDEQSRPG